MILTYEVGDNKVVFISLWKERKLRVKFLVVLGNYNKMEQINGTVVSKNNWIPRWRVNSAKILISL